MDESQRLVAAVDAAVGRLAEPDALGGHGLDLTAAWRTFGRGEEVPPELRRSARNAALVELAADAVLERAVEVVGDGLVLIKGPELAAHYPAPLRRAWWDLDLVAADAPAAQAALVAAGFQAKETSEDYDLHHHLAPVSWRGLPVPIEVHRALGAQSWARVPPVEELLERAVPSAIGVPGLLTLDPVDHAVHVANHAWRTAPLGRLGHLLDVQVLRLASRARYPDADDRLTRTAKAWRLGRMWTLTVAAIESELLGTRRLHPALVPFRGRLRHTNDHSLPSAREARLLAALIHPVLRAPRARRPSSAGRPGPPP